MHTDKPTQEFTSTTCWVIMSSCSNQILSLKPVDHSGFYSSTFCLKVDAFNANKLKTTPAFSQILSLKLPLCHSVTSNTLLVSLQRMIRTVPLKELCGFHGDVMFAADLQAVVLLLNHRDLEGPRRRLISSVNCNQAPSAMWAWLAQSI